MFPSLSALDLPLWERVEHCTLAVLSSAERLQTTLFSAKCRKSDQWWIYWKFSSSCTKFITSCKTAFKGINKYCQPGNHHLFKTKVPVCLSCPSGWFSQAEGSTCTEPSTGVNPQRGSAGLCGHLPYSHLLNLCVQERWGRSADDSPTGVWGVYLSATHARLPNYCAI